MQRSDILSLVFEHSPDGQLLLDGTVIMDCNPRAVELLDYESREDLIGHSPADFSPPKQPDGSPSVERAESLTQQAMREGNCAFEWVHQRRDGSLLPMEVLLTAVTYAGRDILHASWRDITRRREAKAALEEKVHERTRQVQQRQRIAEGLREGLAVLNSNRSLDAILNFIVGQAVHLLHTGGGALYVLDGHDDKLHVGASYGVADSYIALDIPVGGAITGRAVALGEPVSVPDLDAAADLLDTYLHEPDIAPDWVEALRYLQKNYNAILSVPIQTSSQTYGALTLYYEQSQQFSDEVIGLAVAFARQAALVIENARLRERVRETAATEERNRLARDLHDAVTQTLFSASLMADTLPDLWEHDRDRAQAQLNRIGLLTRSALAEMRALLIELRPARLVETDIHTLLQQLVDAVRGRSHVDLDHRIRGTCTMPPGVKIALYRITQEALNNIVKHAQAAHAFVSLACDEERIRLHVLDDGRGFHLESIGSTHFGVQIMRERAAAIDATLAIKTQPGEGTDIQVIWRRDGRANY